MQLPHPHPTNPTDKPLSNPETFDSQHLLPPQQLNSISARPYLKQHLFPAVNSALLQLLDHIQTSGELSRYWSTVDKLNEEARRAARKLERRRKRIEMGSDYQTSEGE